MKILMVCLGNICRSPLAEGLLKNKIKKYNLAAFVDSCGFEYEHLGCQPDYRAIEIASRHNIDITDQKARLFHPSYFDNFDKIYVMDSNNYRMVASKARSKKDLEKVELIMNVVKPGSNIPVPDPYFGRQEHFVETFRMLDEATDKIIDLIRKN
ncbi:MAG TPA: low molecular weight protein-tyrosine-phosphatase [Lentimicrobium sp.]|nr:low molecular weight protein-tyrosine-phosphatase [Lentimicrobium sp.]